MIEGEPESWFTDVELGYLFTSTRRLTFISSRSGDGRVALGERSWSEGDGVHRHAFRNGR